MTVVGGDGGVHELIVALDRSLHSGAMPLPTLGRALDVAEKERDGAAGQRLAFGDRFRHAQGLYARNTSSMGAGLVTGQLVAT